MGRNRQIGMAFCSTGCRCVAGWLATVVAYDLANNRLQAVWAPDLEARTESILNNMGM